MPSKILADGEGSALGLTQRPKFPAVALWKPDMYLCELVHKALDPLAEGARGSGPNVITQLEEAGRQ